jgi:CBS domain-containing protein
LLGLVSRQDALEWRVAGRGEGRLADALSDASTGFAFPETSCGEVADMMVDSGIGRVSVVDPESRKVIGIISRQDLLKVRSQQQSVEQR